MASRARSMYDTTTILSSWPNDRLGPMLANGTQKRDLTTTDILELIRSGRVRFVVADVGYPLKVVSLDDCYDFWKSDVKAHVCDHPETGCVLEDFPEEYFYLASEWDDGSDVPVVVLFKSH